MMIYVYDILETALDEAVFSRTRELKGQADDITEGYDSLVEASSNICDAKKAAGSDSAAPSAASQPLSSTTASTHTHTNRYKLSWRLEELTPLCIISLQQSLEQTTCHRQFIERLEVCLCSLESPSTR